MKNSINRGSHKVKTTSGSVEKGSYTLWPWDGGLKVSPKRADEIAKNNCVSQADLAERREDFLNTTQGGGE